MIVVLKHIALIIFNVLVAYTALIILGYIRGKYVNYKFKRSRKKNVSLVKP